MPSTATHKKQYLLLGSFCVYFGFFGGWLARRLWKPGFDMIGPAENYLLVDAGIYVSYATSPAVLIVLSFFAAVWAIKTHHVYAWLHTATFLSVTTTVSYLGKYLLKIPRPDDALLTLASYSFPSAHAAAAGLLLVVGSFQLQRLWKHHRVFILLCAILAALIIAGSRVVLGVHTISDVIGGLVIGIGLGWMSLWFWFRPTTQSSS
jgi:membrane-associated phospholipid phosphatase